MTFQVTMTPRKIAAAAIKVYALFQVVIQAYGLIGLLWSTASFFMETAPGTWHLGQLLPALGFPLITCAIDLALLFKAEAIGDWMFRGDDTVALSGDPYALALPALQVTGVVFISLALVGLLPLIQAQAAGAPLDGSFWVKAWPVLMHGLMGALLLRYPRPLAELMRRFSKS